MSRACEHIRDLIADSITGILSPDQAKPLEEHLSACADCRRYAEALRREDLSLTRLVAGIGADMASRQQQLLQTLGPRQLKRTDTPAKRRNIMTTSLAKLAVAACIAVAGLFGLSRMIHSPSAADRGPGRFSLLAQACAAEESLFQGTKVVHIQNEIIVYAGASDPAAAEPNFVWLPMCSVKPDGQLQINQLKLAVAPESYVVTDHSWYDPATGRFSRILKAGDAVVFANSYDGQSVWSTTVTPEGMLQTVPQPVADTFRPPESPAAYLGLAPGLQTALDPNNDSVQSVEPGTLHGGAPAHIYKVGMPGPDGQMNSYCLFKVRDEDSTLAEEEFILAGRPQLLVRRVLTETPEAPAVSWSLDEMQGTNAQATQAIAVTPDMVIPRVSVAHMVERAEFETYVFSTRPTWTGDIEITDCLDPASPGGRMFIMTARADDGRHLVLVQSPTYNKMLGSFVKQGSVVYTSANGFKVWGGGPQKWYSEILLRSARASIKDPPAEDRTGYVLESPAGTFPALAVNGPLSDDELHGLVDSLVPAKDYLKSHPADVPEAQP